MWITNTVLDNLRSDNLELRQQINTLQESMSSMKQKIDTMSKATAGIEYGKAKPVPSLYGWTDHVYPRKSLSEVVHFILEHLKLEITETPEIKAQSKLTKIKPVKK